MSSGAQGVTPAGVRDGELGALQALSAARGGAVLAYCRAFCGEELAARATAEAFARFRAAVAAAEQVSGLEPESLLLGATRHAAASLAPAVEHDETAGSGLLTRARRRPGAGGAPCAVVPTLLAARAEGALGPADNDRLERHLSRCAACRAIEARFQEAERAYADPPDAPVPAEVAGAVLAAMTAAAPVGPHAAQEDDDVEMLAGPVVLPEPTEPEATDEPGPESGDEPGPEDDSEAAEPRSTAPPPIDIRGHPSGAAPVPPPEPVPAGDSTGWVVLPIALMLAGVLCAMAVAGVFGGDNATPVHSVAVHVPVERPRDPITTPLPVTIPTATTPVVPDATATTPVDPGATTVSP